MTYEEAATYLKVSVGTLKRMVKNQEITFYRKRNRIKFEKEDLDIWDSWQRIEAKPQPPEEEDKQ